MPQLSLFAPPAKPGEPELKPRSHWREVVKPGEYIRTIRVDYFVGERAKVVPTNFVDEAWPWTGRMLPVAQLRRDWALILPRVK